MAAGKISDDEVQRRLRAASDVLGVEAGQSVPGDTAIETARQALLMLSAGLEEVSDANEAPRP